jgi:polyribonucleotide nucleotidyltransferase
MTRKNFLTQLRQVDNGDNSARMHEVVNQTITQIRENSKFSSTQRTDLEKFYKELRKDLGLNEITSDEVKDVQEDKEDVKITDTRNLNDMIDSYLKNKS